MQEAEHSSSSYNTTQKKWHQASESWSRVLLLMLRRRLICQHLNESARSNGQAAASATGATATVEAAAAEDLLKVTGC